MTSKTIIIALLSFYAVYAKSEVQPKEHWYVKNSAGRTCLIVDAAPVITVKFPDATYIVNLNRTKSFNGDCEDILSNSTAAQSLTVNFTPSNSTSATEDKMWMLKLTFIKEDDKFKLANYSLTTDTTAAFPKAQQYVFEMDPNAINDVVVQKSTDAFRCSSTLLKLKNESSIDMKLFHAIAFANLDGDGKWPNEQVYENCKADAQTSDIVPIIVGACLAGLVVIVLVAYLIGRARAKRQGYASV